MTWPYKRLFRPLKVVVRLEETLRRPAAAEVIEHEILSKVYPTGSFRPGEVFDVERMLKWILDRLPTLPKELYDAVVASQDNDRILELAGDEPLGEEERSRRIIALAVILYLQGQANKRREVADELREGSTYSFGGHAVRDNHQIGGTPPAPIPEFAELVELWINRGTRIVRVYYRNERGGVSFYEKHILEDPADSHMEAARYLFRRYLFVA